MRLIITGILLVLIGVAIGATMRPLQAQSDSSLFKAGQRLTLAFVGDRFVERNVSEIRGSFIRCEDNKIMWFNVDNATLSPCASLVVLAEHHSTFHTLMMTSVGPTAR